MLLVTLRLGPALGKVSGNAVLLSTDYKFGRPEELVAAAEAGLLISQGTIQRLVPAGFHASSAPHSALHFGADFRLRRDVWRGPDTSAFDDPTGPVSATWRPASRLQSLGYSLRVP